MKKRFSWLLGMAMSLSAAAQTTAPDLKSAALSAHMAKDYARAGALWDQALLVPGGKPSAGDFYNAACSWALAGDATKAFLALDQATQAGWDRVADVRTDADLAGLHPDKRWPPMIATLGAAVARAEARYNVPLKRELEAIYETDQGTRRAMGPLQRRYGQQSPQLDSLFQRMQTQDAQNEARVEAIITQYGWPGARLVGRTGSMAAFLVVQHSNLAAIQKYLPLIREETRQGGLAPQNLALMEDRVLVFQGQPQVYGSQVRTNTSTGQAEFFPIAEEARVDERRATMGLGTLADYAKGFGIEYVPSKTGGAPVKTGIK